MLGFAGRNIDKFHLPAFHRSAATAEARRGFWFRWSRRIQRRPWPFAVGALALLLALAFPVTHLKLGFPDAGNDPKGTTTATAYDLLADGLRARATTARCVVATGLPQPVATWPWPRGSTPPCGPIPERPASPRRSPTRPPIRRRRSITVDPAHGAAGRGHRHRWVRHIRNDVIKPVVAGTGVTAKTTGDASFNIDVTKKLSVPPAAVLRRGDRAQLHAADGRVPLGAGAAQGGRHEPAQHRRRVRRPGRRVRMGLGCRRCIGVAKQPIASFSPMMLFAILFGLSMDYEVFLLSRVKEEHDRTHDNGLAVADGLAATARVITAAAAIMVTVFFTFLFQTDDVAKLFGLGLGIGDPRSTPPSSGWSSCRPRWSCSARLNWWLPGWLERLLPRLNVDGAAVAPEEPREPVLVS